MSKINILDNTNKENQFVKSNVSYNEYFIQNWTFELLKSLSKTKKTSINIHVPQVIHYDQDKKQLTMQKIYGDNLSNIYGEDIKDVPIKLIKIIRKLINLMNYYLVEYIDLTGYNFMLDKNDNLWIIDFGHAKCREKDDTPDPFLLEFIQGKLSWNPEFK